MQSESNPRKVGILDKIYAFLKFNYLTPAEIEETAKKIPGYRDLRSTSISRIIGQLAVERHQRRQAKRLGDIDAPIGTEPYRPRTQSKVALDSAYF